MTVMATMPLRVWPACLSCYNSGVLTGAWIDARDAAELTIEKLHRLAGAPLRPDCEEIWCLDGDGPWPDFHEMGLDEAQEWADAYDECPEHLWAALSAWVETGCYIAAGNGDVPVVSDFLAAYRGEYDDIQDYARSYADETGLMADWDGLAVDYFDWERWSSDLEAELTVADAHGGGVYVFDCP